MQALVQHVSGEMAYQTFRGEVTQATSAFVTRNVVEQAVGLAFSISPRELQAPTRRSAPVALARQVAMYMAHVACRHSMTEVGMLFGRDRSTVAYACRIVEDRRDDPVFDRSLDELEAAIVGLSKVFFDLHVSSAL